jgi:uncharacterized membrane protein YfcA
MAMNIMDNILLWSSISLIVIGLLAGFLNGLLGIGGGLILVPFLSWFFTSIVDSHEHAQHMAIATSLATMCITSLSSSFSHWKTGQLNFFILKRMAPSMVLGAILGSFLAKHLAGSHLAFFFVIYAYAIAANMWIGKQPKAERTLPKTLGLTTVGTFIGIISSLVGIGGGSIIVPFLVWCNIEIASAIASSAALTWPVAISGSLAYLWNGWYVQDLPSQSIGFIYLPAFFILAITSSVAAPLGVRCTQFLPPSFLKKAFAILLLIVASQMMWQIIKS